MKNLILRIGIVILAGSMVGCHIHKPKASQNGFSSEVSSIVSNRCYSCHAGGNAEGDMGIIDNANTLISRGYIIPGSPSSSVIYQKVTTPAFGARMPYGGPYLTSGEIATIGSWITAMTAPGATACIPHIVGGNPSWTNDVRPLLEHNLATGATGGGSCIGCHNQTGGTGLKWTLSTSGGTGQAVYAQLFTATACAVTVQGAGAVPDKACLPFAGPMVVAGNPCASRLYRRISQNTQPSDFTEAPVTVWRMPKTAAANRVMTDAELGIIYTWILNGAPNN